MDWSSDVCSSDLRRPAVGIAESEEVQGPDIEAGGAQGIGPRPIICLGYKTIADGQRRGEGRAVHVQHRRRASGAGQRATEKEGSQRRARANTTDVGKGKRGAARSRGRGER